jgi:hypothetical protein
MRLSRGMCAAVSGMTLAAGLMLGSAAPALADTVQEYSLAEAASTYLDGCIAFLESTQTTGSGPMYVTAMVTKGGSLTESCSAWIQRSTDSGAWKQLSPKVNLPKNNGLAWAKTADYYDGPGYQARVCVRDGSGRQDCGLGIGLVNGSQAKSAGKALPVSYVRRQLTYSGVANGQHFQCSGKLASTTAGKAKTAKTYVDAVFENVGYQTPACTGWIAQSTNGGKSWRKASASHPMPLNNNTSVFAFTARYLDSKKRLARICFTVSSSPAKQHCSAAW